MAWRGSISKSMKELRILLCQSSPASAPTRFQFDQNQSLRSEIFQCSISVRFSDFFFVFRFRTFVEKNYKDLKSLNPKFPILIRECSGIQPQMWARYGKLLHLLSRGGKKLTQIV